MPFVLFRIFFAQKEERQSRCKQTQIFYILSIVILMSEILKQRGREEF